uniref:Uncharacterized protein n=1 Tax=Setaria italica TaxID=4555 RepID=K3XTH1_SETIT
MTSTALPARVERCMILYLVYWLTCKLAMPCFCMPHGNFWTGYARLCRDHAVMALLLYLHIYITRAVLVDMTWRSQCCKIYPRLSCRGMWITTKTFSYGTGICSCCTMLLV